MYHKNPDAILNPSSNPASSFRGLIDHRLGTGIGAAGGALAGAAFGTSMAGPVGTVVGAAVGAATGALVGHGTAVTVNPSREDIY